MRYNALQGRRGLWLRQFGDTWEGNNNPDRESRLSAIMDTMDNYGGYDLLLLKCADKNNWQVWNDPLTPMASLADVTWLMDRLAKRGKAFCPVFVPRGVAGEAEFHGAIASIAGCGMTDIEPYDGFWDHTDYDKIPVYARYFRQAAGDAYLINQPDPRPWAVTDSYVRQCAEFFDGICAQHYVGWSSVGWVDVATEVTRFNMLSGWYKDPYITLYGVERIDLAGQFLAHVHHASKGDHAFALGAMDVGQLNFFGRQARAPFPKLYLPGYDPNPAPTPPVPPPGPDQTPIKNLMLRNGLAGQLGEAIAALGNPRPADNDFAVVRGRTADVLSVIDSIGTK